MTKFLRRKRILIPAIAVLCLLVLGTGFVLAAGDDKEDNTIISGVTIGGIDVSGMTAEEAKEAVDHYVDALSGTSVTLMAGENPVEVSASSLGFHVEMTDVYEEAVGLCKKGNIVKRYKDKKHLEEEGIDYDIVYGFDENAIRAVLTEQCTAFDRPAVDATLTRSNGTFSVTEGTTGYQLDIEASVQIVLDFLKKQWNIYDTDVTLAMVETQPKGNKEELSKVKDLLATATTSYATSGANRRGNVERGAQLINGTVVYPGEEFSCYGVTSPITVENGYFMAASYAEGKVVESAGGGICQVSSTLYNAVLKAELEVTQRSNHSMIVSYVEPAMDAAIAGTYKDLKFINNTQYPIYIEGITAGKKITFNIYGVETRSANRTVEYVSEIVEEKEPTVEIKVNESMEFGKVAKDSSHKGIVAKLWKIVKENGLEVSREQVNKSTYAMSPERYTIGSANGTAEAVAELHAAAATQNMDMVNAVIGKYVSVPTDVVPVGDGDLAAEGNVTGATTPDPAPVQTQAPAVTPVQTSAPTPAPVQTPEPVHTEEPAPATPQPDNGVE